MASVFDLSRNFLGCYSKHCKDLSYCPVTPIPAANLFCGHFCFLILSALQLHSSNMDSTDLSYTITQLYCQRNFLCCSVFFSLGNLVCEFMGANFWARDFSGSPGYFFCVSIILPLDYPCHFKSSIRLSRAPTAVILILRGKKLNQFYLHPQLSYKCILILVY